MRNGGAVHKNREAPRRFETRETLILRFNQRFLGYRTRRISFRRLLKPSYLHMQTIPIPARHK